MPRLNKETREQIKSLQRSELEQIVLKMATKEKAVYDFILLNYLDKESGEADLYQATISDLEGLVIKGYRGRGEEQIATNMLNACIKRVNEFTKASKNKKLEADLLMYLLKISFDSGVADFGTYYNGFDYKVSTILKRCITIVTKKLHSDYFIEYQDKLNKYLSFLHKTSNHVDSIYDMPAEI